MNRSAIDSTSALLVVIAAFFPVSPIFNFLVPLPGNYLFLFCCLMVFALRLKATSLTPVEQFYLLSTVLSSLVFSLYWQEMKLVLFPTYFVLSVLTVSMLSERSKLLVAQYASALLLLVCAGALAGFIYAYQGGAPLLSIQNVDGRTASLYLATMTNSVTGNVIRPSGIFDEPGTLSFFICLVAASRNVLRLPRRTTWVLLLAGLVTLSLAHIVYIIFHLLSERIASRKTLQGAILVMLIVVVLSWNTAVVDIFDEFIMARLEIANGMLAGDNRSDLVRNAWDYLSPATLMFGLDPLCVTDWLACQSVYKRFGENFLTPVVQAGLIASLPFYITLLCLLWMGLQRRENLVYLGIAALLLQRPYVMGFNYALIIYFSFRVRPYVSSLPLPVAGRAVS